MRLATRMHVPSAELQRLLAEEPFVRALARSLVADEADDVVQQTYLRALAVRRSGIREPRSWLARIVRNLATDHVRRAAARRAHEQSAPHALVPSSAELAAGEESRRSLVAAVDALPEPLRAVVLLRWFEGLPPRRIARELGLRVSVVWNRLHAALVALRARLDREHGGERRAWLLPLVPFATSPRSLPWAEMTGPASAGPLAMGVIAMTMKTKVAAALGAVLLAVLVVWTTMPRDAQGPVANPTARVEPSTANVAQQVPTSSESAPAPTREPALVAAAPTTGDLVVTVRYKTEPIVAAGRTVTVRQRGGDLRVGVRYGVTDDAGVVRFAGLEPGEHLVLVVGSREVRAAVEAGAERTCEVLLRGGMTLTGIVVDTAGAPIAGALVETGMPASSGCDAAAVAVTAADGTFTLRECFSICLVGARAPGYAASQLHFRMSDKGGTETVRIELLAAGGVVEGVVVDAKGTPVKDAVVRVGEGVTETLISTPQGAPPLPAQVRTDADGRFTAIGLPVGKQPLLVRADGFAPSIGTCEIAAQATSAARVVLQSGATCSGRVLHDGQPVDAATVRFEGPGDFLHLAAHSDATGAFVLRNLPAGDIELKASKDRVGSATSSVRGEHGAVVHRDFELEGGVVLRGRVLDASGAPARGEVHCLAEGPGERWSQYTYAHEDGTFTVMQCPAGRRLAVEVAVRDYVPWQQGGIDPSAGELVVRLTKDTSPRARITGRVLRIDGSGAVGTTVESWKQSPQLYVDVTVQQPDGAFVLEVPTGTWGVRVLVAGHPEIRRDGIELQAGAAHDVGVLQLVRGGTLVVNDDAAAKFDYLVLDARERFVCGLYSPTRPLRSDLLAPGDYLLFARGAESAAQRLPFTITADRETVLTVKPVPGIRRRIEFVPPAGVQVHSISYEVRRDGARVMGNWLESRDGNDLAQDVWLVPGDYELTTARPEPKVSVRFTIAEGTSEPVRVVLR